MDSYLIDEAVLGQFVDSLLEEKYPGQPADAHADVKKHAISALDHQILKAIFAKLTPEQGKELDDLLKDASSDSTTFENFFADYHIDLETIIKDAMLDFKTKFMEGEKDGE